MVPGQPSTDRTDIFVRMFKIKLDELMNDIRKKHHFGRTKANKITTTQKIDQFVLAELPSQENDPVAFEAIRSHMMHGPCGQLNTLSPCMHNGSCSKGYPKEYCDETFIRRDGCPCYKRSNDGSKVKVGNEDIMLDNQYVVPHNVELLVKYGCHIDVEYCNQGSLIKYLFSYINKGHDRATVVLEEACWKLLGFEMQYRSVAVERLPFHEEDCQRVYFREDDDIVEVLDRRVSAVSKFTEWMRSNQLYPEARLLTYSDFPTKFTWHEKGDVKEWRPRKNGLVIGRLYFVNLNEGERWLLFCIWLWRDRKNIFVENNYCFYSIAWKDCFISRSSGIASLLLPGGRTAHSMFNIPIDIDKDSTCGIDIGSDLAELINIAEMII
ncbi:unnamed protein product [Lactuca virosa]|uniref:ATP-dependent DNA helicase n=1 Tax=Lactuca virosa TaxID=75947 RepID=A0AAU9M722_9ASTR|nr:unnamed protein product [Lactuca virosa]